MTRFSTVTPDGRGGLVESNVRVLNQSDMVRCPHVIMMPDHYREDGTCKCNDPNEKVMREWGYRWDKKAKVWK
jgi:hypothetical protein